MNLCVALGETASVLKDVDESDILVTSGLTRFLGNVAVIRWRDACPSGLKLKNYLEHDGRLHLAIPAVIGDYLSLEVLV